MKYIVPEIDVIVLSSEDVIMASGGFTVEEGTGNLGEVDWGSLSS